VSNLAFALLLAVLFKVLTLAGAVDFPFIAALPGQAEAFHSMTGNAIPAIYRLIGTTFVINVVLAIFNFIPVPPLDGSRVLVGLLPDRLGAKFAWLERNPVFVIVMFTVLIFGAGRILSGPVNAILFGILKITGNV
jgi:Zn-dependent protease